MAQYISGLDIFLSYSRNDYLKAETLAKALEAIGWRVWLEPEIVAGKDFYSIIEDALERAKCVVVLWSETSAISRHVENEAQSAWKNNKLASVVLDDGLRLPVPFNTTHSRNLSDWSGDTSSPEFQEFVVHLTKMIGSPGDVPPQPAGSLPIGEQPFTPASPSPDEGIDLHDPFSATGQAAGYAFLDLPKPLYEQVTARALDEQVTVKLPRVEHSPYEAHRCSPVPAESAAPQGRRLVQYAILAGAFALAAWLGIKLLPLILGATSSVKPRRPDESTDETHPVDCSVFAPPKLAAGDAVLVQVYLHPPGRAEEAKAGAKQFDFDAEWRGFTSLSLDLASGTRVAIQLDVEGMDVSDDGFGEMRWNNSVVGVSFQVTSPELARPGKHFGTVRLLVDGIPAGRIHFIIDVDASLEGKVPPEGIGDSAHRYHKAFISYASEDRAEVLKRVQTLGALKIDYFQDVLDLEPGDRWEQELYKEIDKCDLFLLFWSSAARDSKWVYQEAQYARQRQIKLMKDEPDIIPMMIEGPPPPKPWSDFKHLHFNDKLIYLMRSKEDDWDWSG